MENVICPNVNVDTRLMTYGKLEIGDVPSMLFTTKAIPAACTITAKTNKIYRFPMDMKNLPMDSQYMPITSKSQFHAAWNPLKTKGSARTCIRNRAFPTSNGKIQSLTRQRIYYRQLPIRPLPSKSLTGSRLHLPEL